MVTVARVSEPQRHLWLLREKLPWWPERGEVVELLPFVVADGDDEIVFEPCDRVAAETFDGGRHAHD